MERSQHSHNFHLFRWNKLVGAPSPISRVAVGGCVGHEFVATLLESGVLLLRLSSSTSALSSASSFVLARHISLSPLSVRAMAFDRSAQWLLLVCDDLALVLLPVYFLVKGASAQAPSDTKIVQAQQTQLQQQQLRQQEVAGAEKLLQRLGLKKTPSQLSNGTKLPFSDLQDLTIIPPRVSGRTGATGCIWW